MLSSVKQHGKWRGPLDKMRSTQPVQAASHLCPLPFTYSYITTSSSCRIPTFCIPSFWNSEQYCSVVCYGIFASFGVFMEYVCTYVLCVCVCGVCIYVCTCVLCVFVCECMYVCMHVFMYVCMYAFMYLCVYACTCVMHVYVCTYVFMYYVCMNVSSTAGGPMS